MSKERDVETSKGSTVLSVRFGTDELDEIRDTADKAGVPLSAYVRRLALDKSPTTWTYSTACNSSDSQSFDVVVDMDSWRITQSKASCVELDRTFDLMGKLLQVSKEEVAD